MNAYRNFRYFHEPSDFACENLVASDGMGYEMNPLFLIDRTYFNNQLVMFVLQGTLMVEQFEQIFEVHQGCGILMQLTQKHKYYFKKGEETHIIWFHFRGNPVNHLMEMVHESGKLPFVFESEKAENFIYQLFDEAASDHVSKELTLSIQIYSLILEILKKPFLNRWVQENPNNQFIAKVEHYVFRNIGNQITLEGFAEEFNISKYHFCRLFKSILQTTPFEYIKQKKIELAKKMLMHTNDSICEIANVLCFCDQGYFTNTFRAVVGCSPNQFRKNR